MPRFLHTADWQMGRQYGRFEAEDAAALAEARFETVGRLAELAQSRRADAVLVAGDVFDLQNISERNLRRVFQRLEAYNGPWVLLPGNHDAALTRSVWSRAQALGCVPPQVQLALTPGVIDLPQADMAVLAAPLTQRQVHSDLTQPFDDWATPPGRVRVGLAHGSVLGHLPEGLDMTNPIAADRVSRARLDYLALGDWHGCLSIDARTWYAGTPEPDRFRGERSGQALWVEIDAPGATPRVEACTVGRYLWRDVAVSLQVPEDVAALAAQVAEMTPETVLRLTLSGSLGVTVMTELEEVLARVAGRVRALRVRRDGLRVQPDAADLDRLADVAYLRDVLASLRALQDDPAQAAVAREALVQLLRLHDAGETA